jgi:hypothetical protein
VKLQANFPSTEIHLSMIEKVFSRIIYSKVMKRKIFTLLTAGFVLTSFAVASFAKTGETKKSSGQTNRLAARLPVSDMAARMDLQRLMTAALPQILKSNPQMMSEVNAKIDEIKAQTGIDLRSFEQLAVGFKYQQIAPKNLDLQAIALVSGKTDTDTLIAAMKIAAKDKFREEKSGANTIYIFTPREIAPNTTGGNKSITVPGLGVIGSLDKIFAGEIAVTVIDKNTLAIGKPSRVRETLESKARIEQNILALVNRNQSSVISFGGNAPANLSQLLNLDNDDLGKNLDSIRQLSGGMDVANGNATIAVTAKSATAQQAQALEETVTGLQMFGKSILGGLKGDDKAVYSRIVDTAKISRQADEVSINLLVSQSDIDILVGKK